MTAASTSRELFRGVRQSLVRLTLVLLATNLFIQTVAWLYPVQHELEVAWEKRSEWAVSSPIEVRVEDLGQVQRDFGNESLLIANWESNLSSSLAAPRTVEAYVSSTVEGYFPPATRIRTEDVGDRWIDVDIRTAREMNLEPGDHVHFAIDKDSTISLRVRGVYAVDLGFGPAVSLPAAAVLAVIDDPTESEANVMNELFVFGKTVAHVESELSRPFYREKLIAGGYYPDRVDVKALGVESRETRLAQAEDYSSTNLSVIAAISLLSALALVGIIQRELLVFIGSVSRTVSTLHRIGASWRRLWVSAAGLALSASVLGLVAGVSVAVIAFANGLTGATFPLTLVPVFLGANFGLLLACALGVICATLFVQRRGAEI